jgi:hypothetical protein
MGHVLDWLKAPGYYGVPHWGLLAFALILVGDYTLPRLKNPRARSFGELLANASGLLFGRFPVLGILFKKVALVAGTPQAGDATAKPDEPNPAVKS